MRGFTKVYTVLFSRLTRTVQAISPSLPRRASSAWSTTRSSGSLPPPPPSRPCRVSATTSRTTTMTTAWWPPAARRRRRSESTARSRTASTGSTSRRAGSRSSGSSWPLAWRSRAWRSAPELQLKFNLVRIWSGFSVESLIFLHLTSSFAVFGLIFAWKVRLILVWFSSYFPDIIIFSPMSDHSVTKLFSLEANKMLNNA